MYGYHGGGLTRHQYLVHTSDTFLPPEQTWVHSSWNSTSLIQGAGGTPAGGLTATGIELVVRGTAHNTAGSANVWAIAEFINLATDSVVATDGKLLSQTVCSDKR